MGRRAFSEGYSNKDADARPNSETALSLWLKANQCSMYKMGLSIRAQPSQIAGWANGRQIPNLIYAFRIDKFTKGAVPVSSWLGTPLGRIMWRDMGVDPATWKVRHRQAEKMSRLKAKAAEVADGAPPQE